MADFRELTIHSSLSEFFQSLYSTTKLFAVTAANKRNILFLMTLKQVQTFEHSFCGQRDAAFFTICKL